MINGAFNLLIYKGEHLFLKRKTNGLWDLVGGGFDVDEVDYKGVAIRETKEETGIDIAREQLILYGILGQTLPKRIQEKYQVQKGLIFLHAVILRELPEIVLSDEHTEYKFFSQKEVFENYQQFSSGPLWEFFTYLAFQETCRIQEGMLKERSMWLGKSYV